MYTRLFKDELSSFLTVSERANGKKKNQELKMVNQQVGHEFHIPGNASPRIPNTISLVSRQFPNKNSFQNKIYFLLTQNLTNSFQVVIESHW